MEALPLLAGGLLLAMSLNLGTGQQSDWLNTPRQKLVDKQKHASADMLLRNQTSLLAFAPIEKPQWWTQTDTSRRQASVLNGTDSLNPAVRKMAVKDVVLNNRRLNSGKIGISFPYDTSAK